MRSSRSHIFSNPTFEVRRADSDAVIERCTLYHDACLFADVARAELGIDVVVFSLKLKRNLYDSRKLGR